MHNIQTAKAESINPYKSERKKKIYVSLKTTTLFIKTKEMRAKLLREMERWD